MLGIKQQTTDVGKKYLTLSPDAKTFFCEGDWTLQTLPHIQDEATTFPFKKLQGAHLSGKNLKRLDSAGAWLITVLIKQFKKKGETLTLKDFSPQHEKLLSLVTQEIEQEKKLPPLKKMHFLAVLGRGGVRFFKDFNNYLSLVGHLSLETLRIASVPHRFRLAALINVIDQTGFRALPIIALLSFMIGVVICYQMGVQLKNYGANIYIVDLLGLSILREFGPLLTAIMVAGRTGAAFTAQIGTMKVNQEIDALNTMGVTPAELLLLPRIFGLFITLPLLTMWADIFGVIGGMLMAKNMLDIGWTDFLLRFEAQIPLRSLLIGLGKAPVFALLIASIGCYTGMQVKGSADSVGKETTRSVVLSIFFIIVADAFFSVLFSKLKL